MNSFANSFFPRFKAVVTQEAWYKGKVILQHFSNLSENVKNENIENNDDQACVSDNTLKGLEINKCEKNNEIQPTTSSIGDSLKHLELKAKHFKEPVVKPHDESLKNIDLSSAIENIGKGVAVNWRITRGDFFQDDNLQGFDPVMPKPLDVCKEDVSDIGPVVTSSVNFASFANKSPLVQELYKLGVDFYKIERVPANVKFLMSLDFDKDVRPYIQFLNDCNVDPAEFGKIITRSPKLFGEDLEDLRTRIRYLRAHAFSRDNIARIVTVNPIWLLFNTRKIDERLGYFQYEFKMKGAHVRSLAVKSPELITYNMKIIKENTFAVKEEMGFDVNQMRDILLSRPVLWMNHRKRIVACFDYVHNTMKISHDLIASQPDILLHRKRRVEGRHLFLVELNKAQYDPNKPNYISLKTLVEGNDVDFCTNVAKTSIDTYNLFLKSF